VDGSDSNLFSQQSAFLEAAPVRFCQGVATRIASNKLIFRQRPNMS
jgi:hypothetical protein